MDKLKTVVFTTAVFTAFGALVVVKAQQEEIEKLKKHNQHLNNWGKIMVDAVNSHVANGGDFRISPSVINDLDAFAIFTKNGMA